MVVLSNIYWCLGGTTSSVHKESLLVGLRIYMILEIASELAAFKTQIDYKSTLLYNTKITVVLTFETFYVKKIYVHIHIIIYAYILISWLSA